VPQLKQGCKRLIETPPMPVEMIGSLHIVEKGDAYHKTEHANESLKNEGQHVN
jgi:hypothetical protein